MKSMAKKIEMGVSMLARAKEHRAWASDPSHGPDFRHKQLLMSEECLLAVFRWGALPDESEALAMLGDVRARIASVTEAIERATMVA
jgi:hypothetical protein